MPTHLPKTRPTSFAAGLLIAALLGGCSTQMAPSSATPSSGQSTGLGPSAASSGFPRDVEVNGHVLTVDCRGSRSPTVILENGHGMLLHEIGAFQRELARHTMTCAYQRYHGPKVRTDADLNADLVALLDGAGIPGPYVLVGHSLGGELVQLYARTYPKDVIGVLAMNSGPPCGPWLEALPQLGNDQLLADETAICAGQEAGVERIDGNASWEEALAAPAPPNIPFDLVISISRADWCPPDTGHPGPFTSQEQCQAAFAIHEGIARDLVAAWPMGAFSEVDAGHAIWTTNPGLAVQLVLDLIARTGT